MDENSKKRSRKSKLVPRECLDSDDENIAVMQKEIEETLIQIKNKSILKRLSNPPQPKPLEFSVKIEVEEIDEVADNEPDLNIKIGSVKSLSGPSSPAPALKKGPNVAHYTISPDVIREEFDKLSQETTSEADKSIEITLLNYFGKKKIPLVTNPVDEKLQNIFRKKWRNFRFSFPEIRDVPLMYKCYICNIAWWYLYDFREHVSQHPNASIDLETNCHECNVIAYQGAVPAMKGIWIDSKCWRCSKTVVAHVFLGNVKTTGYRCSGCMEKFYTCRLLKEHESNCLFYRDSIQVLDEGTMNFFCNICPVKVGSYIDMQEHMVLRHSVRSDIPVDWHLRTCGKCEVPYHLQALHDCAYKLPTTSCEFCFQKFKSHLFVLIHLNSTKHYYPCKICGKKLRKQCMELEHLMEHTDNYVALYKCIHCSDSILFPDLDIVIEHNNNSHRRQLKTLSSCYEMVVVPKRLIEKNKLIKPIKSEKKQKSLPSVVEKNFNTACQGLLGFLDQIVGKDGETDSVVTTISDCDVNAEDGINENSDHPNINFVGTNENEKNSEIVKTNCGDTHDLDKNRETEKINTGIAHDLDKNSETGNTNPENRNDLTKNGETDKASPEILLDYDKNSVATDENQKDSEMKKTNTEELNVYFKIKKTRQKRIQTICRLIKPYSRPEKPKKEKKVIWRPKCRIQNKVSTDVQMPEKTQENEKEKSSTKDSQLSEKIKTNSQPQIVNSADLVIKQEKPDDYEVDTIQEQPLEFHEIKIENNMTIKKEINLDIPEDDINKNKTTNIEPSQYNEINIVDKLNTIIKEEPVFDEYSNELDTMNVHQKDNQQMNFPINKEVDEFSANNLNTLDGVSTCSDVDPIANDAPLASDEIELQTLEPEVIVYHTYGKKKYRCKKCGFEGFHFAYREHLKGDQHMRARLKRRRICRSPKRFEQQPVQRYTCTKCNEAYRTFYKYIIHFNKVHDYKPLTCPKCMRQLLNAQSFQSHIHTHIRDSFVTIYLIKNKGKEENNRHQCQTCSVKVNTADFFEHWESHLEIAKDTQTWKAYIPEMENKPDLKRILILLQGQDSHSNRGLPNKLRDCHMCMRSFERKNECKRHFIEHLLADAYQERHKHGFLKCQICGQGFYTSERYKRHMRDHASLPLYKCELCDKAFSDSSNFTKHKKVHNLSVLICDICNKKFTGKTHLEKHMLMHQKIQPKVCQECNRVFYSESSYRKHMTRGQIRFKCNSCEIFFSCLREKWDHMWEVHKERKFKADCPLCEKSFRKHQDVRQHIRYEHADYNFKYVPNKTPLKEHRPEEVVVMYMNESLCSNKS